VVVDREHDIGRWSRRSAMSGASLLTNVGAKQGSAEPAERSVHVHRSTSPSRARLHQFEIYCIPKSL
jgi:hypothetical protein